MAGVVYEVGEKEKGRIMSFTLKQKDGSVFNLANFDGLTFPLGVFLKVEKGNTIYFTVDSTSLGTIHYDMLGTEWKAGVYRAQIIAKDSTRRFDWEVFTLKVNPSL